MLALWEWLRGERYERTRERERQAARQLLTLKLPLPLTIDLLEQVYHLYYDDFWRSRYGELHVSHLVGTERSGSLRIVRWLIRLKSSISFGVGLPSPSAVEILHEPKPPARMIEWQGRIIPEEQAYHEGYQGGFERFLPGDHPDDDLAAAAARLKAEGKLTSCKAKEGAYV